MKSAKSALLMTTTIVCAGCLSALSGCTNLKDFEGVWEGSVSEDVSVRAGFPANTEMELNIHYASTRKLEAEITTCLRDLEDGTCLPGDFQDSPLEHLEKVQNDTLNTLTFGGEPYAVFLMTAQPVDPAEAEIMAFVSLHGKDRVEVRLLRGQEIYGVFRLSRPRDK